MKPSAHFLFENQLDSVQPQLEAAGGGGGGSHYNLSKAAIRRKAKIGVQGFRRTHVSLEAVTALLLSKGFADPSKVEVLTSSLARLTKDIEQVS